MDITSKEYADGITSFTEGIQQAMLNGSMEFDRGKRILRTIWSQPNDRFAEFFTGEAAEWVKDPEIASQVSTKMMGQVEKDMQRFLNYSQGVQGHHPISVSSMEAASRHLPVEDRLQFLKTFYDRYAFGGTDQEGMFPLSNFAHQNDKLGSGAQGKLTNKPKPGFNAHIDSDPRVLAQDNPKDAWSTNQGTWQHEDFSDILDPDKLADDFWNRSGEPQVRLADLAFDQPQEQAFRQKVAEKLGIEERQLYTYSIDKKTGKRSLPNWASTLKEKGVGIQDIDKMAHEAYGMPYKAPPPPLPPDPTKPKVAKPINAVDPNSPFFNPPARKPTNGPSKGGLKFGIPNVPGLAKAGAVVAGVLPIFDAADAVAGTVGAIDSTKSRGDRLASTFQAVSGATGLASLHPAVAPVTGPISLATAGLSAATQRRADMDKPKPKPANYGQGTSGFQAQVKPITNHNRASLKPTPNMPKQKEKSPLEHLINEGKWGLKQLGINL